MRPGESAHVPGGAKHAFRNTRTEPVVQLVTTTTNLGRFFREIGTPVDPRATEAPPAPADLERFARLAAKYGHWLGSPEENARIGLSLPEIPRG